MIGKVTVAYNILLFISLRERHEQDLQTGEPRG